MTLAETTAYSSMSGGTITSSGQSHRARTVGIPPLTPCTRAS
jgi:hypothetical protein